MTDKQDDRARFERLLHAARMARQLQHTPPYRAYAHAEATVELAVALAVCEENGDLGNEGAP